MSVSREELQALLEEELDNGTREVFLRMADRLFANMKAKALKAKDAKLATEIIQQVNANLSLCNELLDRMEN